MFALGQGSGTGYCGQDCGTDDCSSIVYTSQLPQLRSTSSFSNRPRPEPHFLSSLQMQRMDFHNLNGIVKQKTLKRFTHRNLAEIRPK
jgi:hypothetical protein